MTGKKINPMLFRELKKNCGDDRALMLFLQDLVWEESEHSSRWKFNKKYYEVLEKYSKEWRNSDED